MTVALVRSITLTLSASVFATYARRPDGSITRPIGAAPVLIRRNSRCDDVSKTATSPLLAQETSARLPSGVNFIRIGRFAQGTVAATRPTSPRTP